MDTDLLKTNRDQLWAEALSIYREMRAAQPYGMLPLYLTTEEAQGFAMQLQDDAEMNDDVDAMVYDIQNYLNEPYEANEEFTDLPDTKSGLIWREKVAVAEIWKEVFEQAKPPNNTESRNVRKALNKLGWQTNRNIVEHFRDEGGVRQSVRYFRPTEEADAQRVAQWDAKVAVKSEPQRELETDDFNDLV